MEAFHFDSVDSTNEAAKRLIAEGKVRETAYVLAREQTAGKGTRGRQWVSPRDAGVYLSVIHVGGGNDLPTTTVYALSAGAACVEALAQSIDLAVRIKPINDLWVEGRKLGGILTETHVQAGSVTALITGIGINVRSMERAVEPAAAKPVALQDLLSSEQFKDFDPRQFVERLADRVDFWHRLVFQKELGRVEAEWKRHLVPGTSPAAIGHGE